MLTNAGFKSAIGDDGDGRKWIDVGRTRRYLTDTEVTLIEQVELFELECLVGNIEYHCLKRGIKLSVFKELEAASEWQEKNEEVKDAK